MEESKQTPKYYTIFMNQKTGPKPYKYYDTPDGQDFGQKFQYMLKISTKAGVVAGATCALLEWNRGDHYLRLYKNWAKYGIPWILAGSVYTAATYAITKYREKDTPSNSAFGGAVAGLVFGTYFSSVNLTLGAIALFTNAAYIKKIAHLEGITFPVEPKPKLKDPSWTLRNFDTTWDGLTGNFSFSFPPQNTL